ncbi:hypothetical protein [Lysobacter tyrosinilyticus]
MKALDCIASMKLLIGQARIMTMAANGRRNHGHRAMTALRACRRKLAPGAVDERRPDGSQGKPEVDARLKAYRAFASRRCMPV